eukprot:Blabericola_migrator_1__318@NODE_1081_length_5498_cov_180_853802_g740_i0_p1_GENE_NODE_1081_length_5498_cov_180_853802_g740_i0NODE_1081_length_5498_cov_180_853802_g740_i0_p1_ORF_typecomplete_len566_score47_91Metallophos/PF00149_28/1_4e10_NODE_1081_length_5498_cov_180_853802_g740_i025914288
MRWLLLLTAPATFVQGRLGSFLWVSDLHVELLYSHTASQSTYCRNHTDDVEVVKDIQRVIEGRALSRDVDWQSFEYPSGETDPIKQPIASSTSSSDLLLPAYHGRYGCDTPPTLVWATLMDMRRRMVDSTEIPDFILVTGDLAGHYWSKDEERYRLASLIVGAELLYRALKLPLPPRNTPFHQAYENQSEFLQHLLRPMMQNTTSDPLQTSTNPNDPAGKITLSQRKSLLSSSQIILCPGNNDLEADYQTSENSTWNRIVYDMWRPFGGIPSTQKSNFLRGMYYSVTPSKNPAMRIICLNTNWWSNLRKPREKSWDPDPAGQFEWLTSELRAARQAGQTVMLAGHIPPAHSFFRNAMGGMSIQPQWVQEYNTHYYELIQQNADIIGSQVFGHFHTDQFRLQMQPRESGVSRPAVPLSLILLAPGVCPNHATNPAWRWVTYDKVEGSVKDFRQYSTKLSGSETASDVNLGTWNKFRLPTFHLEYVATEKFGIRELSASLMYKALMSKLANRDASVHRYWNIEEVQALYPPAFLLRCVLQEDYILNNIYRCCNRYIHEHEEYLLADQ